MEEKIAGSFFKDESDRQESVITISVDTETPNEVNFASQDASVMICVNREDLIRVVNKLNTA